MAEDLSDLFGPASDDEKIEAFEQSTAILILTQVGLTASRAKQLQEEYGPAFTLPWIAESLNWNTELWATRSFSFKLSDILLAPHKSPIVKLYKEHIAETDAEASCYTMVFKAYEVGRLVATSVQPTDRPYVCAFAGDPGMYITVFKNFFNDTYGGENEL